MDLFFAICSLFAGLFLFGWAFVLMYQGEPLWNVMVTFGASSAFMQAVLSILND